MHACVGGLCSYVHMDTCALCTCTACMFMCADARAVFVYVDLCVYIVYSCVYRCMNLYAYMCICVSTHVHTFVCIKCMCVYKDVNIQICMSVCGVCVYDL